MTKIDEIDQRIGTMGQDVVVAETEIDNMKKI